MFLQTLWFMIKSAAVIAAAIWLALRPGEISLSAFDYDITIKTGVALCALFIAFLVILFIHKIILAILSLPRFLRQRREKRRHARGLKALTVGLAAVAAGDHKIAAYQSYRARKLLPGDQGLPLFLEAQAARMKGQMNEARASFQKLMDQRDTAFLGLRGLLVTAMEEGDLARALTLAAEAARLHPRQNWIQILFYQLSLRARKWNDAQKILQQLEKLGALPADKIKSDRMTLLLQCAEEAQQRGDIQSALRLARKAQCTDPSFIPAALHLARLYRDQGSKRAAIKVIESCWRENPHPEFVPLWESLAPVRKNSDIGARLRWFERLLALKPDSAEGQIAAARTAMEEGLWGEARQYLAMAERLEPGSRLYRLWARYAEHQHQPEEARLWLEKAAEAKPDKVWTCRETGRIYDRWHAVAEPHGAFNTIIWGNPGMTVRIEGMPALTQSLLIESDRVMAGQRNS